MTGIPEVLIRAIIGSAAAGTLIQAVPSPDASIGFIQEISKLGIVGFLGVSVYVLWKKLGEVTKDRDDRVQAKDELLLGLYKEMAGALAANKATVEKMSETLCHMDAVLAKLDTVRQAVHGD